MFGLAWPELLLIGAVAVIVIGPKDIPPLMKQAGVWSRKARLMMQDFQKHWDDLPNQVDMASMQREADELQRKTFEKYGVDVTKVESNADHHEDTAHIAANTKVEPPKSDEKAPHPHD
ncbi:MAG: twin-arginine translocase TatA/TatE family subunit [Alphaproteobacteria bacterium]|nr:twin-arginine translocase TatA/TatE family subunit [Alphaproteobacteria bacterium]